MGKSHSSNCARPSGRVPPDHRARCRLGSTRHRPYRDGTRPNRRQSDETHPHPRAGSGQGRRGTASRHPSLVLGHGRAGRADRASASGDRQRADLGLPAAGVREGRLPRHRLFAARLLQLRALRPRTILVSAPKTFGTSRMSWALDDFMWWRRRPAAALRRTSRSLTRTGS